MPTEQAISTLQDLEEQVETQLSTVPDDDPFYADKVQEIRRSARVAQYKAMKSLNAKNERLPMTRAA